MRKKNKKYEEGEREEEKKRYEEDKRGEEKKEMMRRGTMKEEE